MIKAIIFDVGGVLVNDVMNYIFEDIKSTLKIDDQTFKNAWNQLTPIFGAGKISEHEYWKKFLETTGSQEKLPKKSLFLRKYEQFAKPNHEVLNLVRKLKKSGFKVAVLSDTNEVHVSANTKLGIFEDFEVTIHSNEVGLRKPAKELFSIALKELNVDASETVFIDDKKKNVAAARKLGFKGIVFVNARNLELKLAELGIL